MNGGATSRLFTQNKDWEERFSNRLPHIFVGIVAFQDFPNEIYLSHMLWWGQTIARLKGKARLSIGTIARKEQYRARNILIDKAEQEGADFLLMIDDDQTLHDCPEMIEEFYALGKPIAGGLYYQRGGCYHPVVMKEFRGAGDKTRYRFLRPEELPKEPAPVDVLGGGCHWLDTSVLARFKQPQWWPIPGDPENVIYLPDSDYGLDVNFCRKAKALGYECWLHPGIKLGHLCADRKIIDESTRPSQEEIEKSVDWQHYLIGIAGAQGRPE